jgi:hypothetical protein
MFDHRLHPRTIDWRALVDKKRKKPEVITCGNCGAENNVSQIGCLICGTELR